jgi:uncharacterized protein (TIGR02147 family)
LVAVQNTFVRPRPEDFTDYRAYLREMIAYLKATRPQFSYRFFSRIAGFNSPNFLKLVAEGERNLTPASIPKFAKGLGLDDHERDVFETLVMLSHAESDVERNRYFGKLRVVSRGDNAARRLEVAQFDVYSRWYVLPIRELLLHPDFVEDPAWIANRMRPRIKPTEAREALEILERVGLAGRNAEGRLEPQDTNISTGPRVRSLAIRNFHRAMLEKGGAALESVAFEKRDFTALTLSLTEDQYLQVRSRLEAFRREILELVSAPSEGAEVYHLGLQLFPTTRKDEP